MTIVFRSVLWLTMTLAVSGVCGATTHQIDGTHPNGGDCPMFGSWEAATQTCRIVDALLADGDWLVIHFATVEIAGVMTNEGLLRNHGTLVVDGFLNSTNDLVNFWEGTMVVRGHLFSYFMYNFGRLTNEATGTVEFEFHVENNAPLTNHGHMTIGGTFINIPQRTLENHGSMDIASTGVLTNEGLFIHVGELDNQGTLQNSAAIVEHCESTYTGNPIQGQPSTSEQSMNVGADSLTWCAVDGATDYDVVEGDLSLLRSSGGDFSTATTICLGNDLAGLSVDHAADPGSGEGRWFLVRANGVPSAGFDTVFASQVASRNAGIAASRGACP